MQLALLRNRWGGPKGAVFIAIGRRFVKLACTPGNDAGGAGTNRWTRDVEILEGGSFSEKRTAVLSELLKRIPQPSNISQFWGGHWNDAEPDFIVDVACDRPRNSAAPMTQQRGIRSTLCVQSALARSRLPGSDAACQFTSFIEFSTDLAATGARDAGMAADIVGAKN